MDLIGHSAIIRELATFARSAEPPHALLFAGPESVGRRQLALAFAQLLNCEGAARGQIESEATAAPPSDVACGQCRACRLIREGLHPDVTAVTPGDALCRPRPGESGHEQHPASRDIRICQVRGIIDLVSRYPVEGLVRTIIIDPADRLGREAANTLLKTLEEPPGHTVFVLVTAAPEAVLETISSRCRRIDIGLVPREEIEGGLRLRGVDSKLAGRAASECHGRPGRALAFVGNPDEMEVRSRLIERCARMAAQPKIGRRLTYAGELSERWRRDRESITAELDAWEAFWEAELRRVATEERSAAPGVVAALRAVAQARADLLAQVLPRPALELMLLHFPRVTLGPDPHEEVPAAHA